MIGVLSVAFLILAIVGSGAAGALAALSEAPHARARRAPWAAIDPDRDLIPEDSEFMVRIHEAERAGAGLIATEKAGIDCAPYYAGEHLERAR